MSRQALNGKLAGKTNDTAGRKSPEDAGAPLDYALSVMHDEAQPTTLRATMARAALPFLHSRRVPMLPMPVEDRRSDFGLRAPHDAPATAATLTPRRWSEKLQAADARAQASEAEAQRHAALFHAAEERAQVAETRTRELEKKLLAAQTHAREMEQRAHAMEERAVTAEAMVARLKKGKARAVKPAQESASRVLDDDALRQLKAVQESLLNAEERARKAEMRAYDMEQRSLAAEAIIAGSR